MMEITDKDEQQKRELIINSLDKNIFVEAGAGAGKTSIIVSRIIRQLQEGIGPERIVAITFTNAATRELRGRILREARKAAEDTGIEADKRENIRKALDHIDQMQISTIHGFCHRLLSERCFDAKLSMNFEVLDDDEKLFQDSIVEWAERNLRAADWKKLRKVEVFSDKKISRSSMLGDIKYLARQIVFLPPDTEIKVAFAEYDVSQIEAELKSFAGEALKKFDDFTDQIMENAEKINGSKFCDLKDEWLSKYGSDIKAAYASGTPADQLNVIFNLPSTKGLLIKVIAGKKMEDEWGVNKKDQAAWKEKLGQLEAELKQWIEGHLEIKDRVMSFKTIQKNNAYRIYVEYAKEAARYYREHLSADTMTNDLLLLRTLDLLQNEEIRNFFAEKFSCYYVDEFQDTDRIQTGIIRKLTESPQDPERLRKGVLFVVGDPKQSIYRFRGAEPEIYFQVKEWMKGLPDDNALVLNLADNYRSVEEIVDWVNKQFQDREIPHGHNYFPMQCGRTTADFGQEKHIIGVYKYKNPLKVTEEKDIVADADALCKLIRHLVDEKYKIAEEREGKKYLRDVKYSDILVLCMYMKDMNIYADLMRAQGIPFVMDSKTDVSKNYYVNAFLRLYAYLTDPFNWETKIGALGVLRASNATDEKKNEEILELLYKDTRKMSGYGCLRYLLKHYEIFLEKDCDIEAFQMEDIQRKLNQMVSYVCAEQCDNRAALLELMKTYATRKIERELQLSSEQNAVRFMNLHKAKGLEGNIVIWTGRSENVYFRKTGSYRSYKVYYPILNYQSSWGEGKKWAAYDGDEELIAEAQKETEYERIRLEYVAVTRAKQALIFMDQFNENPGNLFSLGYDLDGLRSIEGIVAADDNVASAQERSELTSECQDKAMPNQEEQRKLGAERFLSVSPSKLENESAGKEGMLTAQEWQAQGEANVVTDENGEHDGELSRPTGNILGTVMHRSFELLIERWKGERQLRGDGLELLCRVCIRQAINENRADIPSQDEEKYKAFLEETMKVFTNWFVTSKLWQEAEAFYTELPFSYLETTDTEAEPPVWLHGEMDLVVRQKDGSFHVIDYKSDTDKRYRDETSFENRLKGKYSRQILAYKAAVSRLFHVAEDRVGASLISFSQKDLKEGESLRVRVTEI